LGKSSRKSVLVSDVSECDSDSGDVSLESGVVMPVALSSVVSDVLVEKAMVCRNQDGGVRKRRRDRGRLGFYCWVKVLGQKVEVVQ
jgi:hypothetical protein